jgi:integrase
MLGYDACKDLIRFWCRRPPTKNRKTGEFDGPPMAISSARHHRKELDRFFRWLDATERFDWVLPRGFRRIDRSISETEDEFAQRLSVIQKDTYTVEELATLNRHATPLERLVLYVGLNCGMGAAELGRLRANDILLFHKHEYEERLGFSSTNEDSFVRYLRPKTKVFGEWLLWPETVQMVQWGLERSKAIDSELLFVSESGRPWYNDEHNKNPQAKFTNTFNRLIGRVQKSDPSFRHQPFGTLRDTLPNILRSRHSSEMASICLAHGSTFRDKLIDCYTNKPFGRFHELMRTARNYVAAVFEASPNDPTATPVQQYIPLSVRKRIQAMLNAEEPVGRIAKECSVSTMTVYRERDRGRR